MRVKVVIVGGGPAAHTAGIYCGRAALNPLIVVGEISPSDIPGGQLMKTTDVENFPGFPEGISGIDLMQKLQDQSVKFGAQIVPAWATNFQFNLNGLHRVTL